MNFYKKTLLISFITALSPVLSNQAPEPDAEQIVVVTEIIDPEIEISEELAEELVEEFTSNLDLDSPDRPHTINYEQIGAFCQSRLGKIMLNQPQMRQVVEDIFLIVMPVGVKAVIENHAFVLDQLLSQNPDNAKLQQLRTLVINQKFLNAVGSFLLLVMFGQALELYPDFAGLRSILRDLAQEKFALCKKVAVKEKCLAEDQVDQLLKVCQDAILTGFKDRSRDLEMLEVCNVASWKLLGVSDDVIQEYKHAMATYQGDPKVVINVSMIEDLLKRKHIITRIISTVFGNSIAGNSLKELVIAGIEASAGTPETSAFTLSTTMNNAFPPAK